MRLPILVLVLVAASACGGNAGAGPGRGDYFEQLERVSENAHIQERGLGRDLRIRLREASGGQERSAVLVVFVDQSARLYADVVDALAGLEPEEEVRTAHDAFLEAWRSHLELMATVRDAGFSASETLEALERPAFADVTATRRARCDELQAAVTAAGREVDLVCDGRPV